MKSRQGFEIKTFEPGIPEFTGYDVPEGTAFHHWTEVHDFFRKTGRIKQHCQFVTFRSESVKV